MKVAKNMEAIFMVAATLVLTATYATAAQPGISGACPSAPCASVASQAKVPTLTVTAKRLSAEEKARMA